MAQELVPQALALARTFHEPRDVGDHELVLVEAHHAEVRLQRGEGVAGDLWLGRRNARDERRLAGIGEPDERHVGHELDLEVVPGFLADLTLFCKRRCSPAVGEEPGVALAALSSSGGQPARAGLVDLGHHLALEVAHDRPLGDGYLDVGPGPPMLALAGAVSAGGGAAVGVVLEGEQRSDVVVRDQPHVPALAAVAPVGAAFSDVRLTAERNGARAAVTGLYMELALVNEHERTSGASERLLGPRDRARHGPG